MIDDIELTDDEAPIVTRDRIEARIQDWKQRLNVLFEGIHVWANGAGWKVEAGSIPMDEDLMRRFEIPASDQPTLRLDRDSQYALFMPKALWVIGANGRVDLYTSKGVYVIVDRAKYGNAPVWTIFRASDKRDGEVFSPDMISRLS